MTRSPVSYCSGTAPVCWATKCQSCPGKGRDKGDSNMSLKFWAEKGCRGRGRAMLCELLLHPALPVQASHRPSYTPGLLKHGKKRDLLTALESELCPKFLQHCMLGNCLHHSIPFQLPCSRRDILQVELQPPAGLPSRSCRCCWHCWKGRMDTSQDTEPIRQR